MKQKNIIMLLMIIMLSLTLGLIAFRSLSGESQAEALAKKQAEKEALLAEIEATLDKISAQSAATTPPPAPKPAPKPNQCIVTIQGVKYNVTTLRRTHPGGDVFRCGQDNTRIFFSEHSQSFLQRKMAGYRVR